MIHTMIDLETWSTENNALIPSIGAVKFDSEKILDRFHVGIDPEDAERYGLHISAGTVLWWLHADRAEARERLLALPKIDMFAALDGLDMWIQQTPVDERGDLWGNGAVFNNVILRTAFRAANLEYPFDYKHDACYRTLKNMAPDVEFERIGVHHNAVDDAESQALHLQKICKKFGLPL